MKGKIRLGVCAFLVPALLLWAAPALATPPLPHAFYGTVKINNTDAPTGTVVSAKINGVNAGSYTTTATGQYGSVAERDYLAVSCDGANDGDTITFYVKGHYTNQTDAFNIGGGPTELNLTVTISGVGGGGWDGDGGEIGTDLFGTEGSYSISDTGEILETITATSADGDLTVTIEDGTIALDADGDPLGSFTVEEDLDPPDPPEDANIIGLAYSFGPAGATFDPFITIEFTIDPATIPSGVDPEDVVLAYYDEEAGEWVELTTTYDPATNTFTASTSHFTTFAVIAGAAPAAFSLSDLSIYPAEVEIGETVTITVSVANTGGMGGSYAVILKINDVAEAEESVTVAAGDSEDVSFSISKEEAGSYSITVEGLGGSFTVAAPPPTAPPEEIPVPPEAPPEVEPGINWPMVGGIIAAAVAGAVGGAIWYKRRRRLG